MEVSNKSGRKTPYFHSKEHGLRHTLMSSARQISQDVFGKTQGKIDLLCIHVSVCVCVCVCERERERERERE